MLSYTLLRPRQATDFAAVDSDHFFPHRLKTFEPQELIYNPLGTTGAILIASGRVPKTVSIFFIDAFLILLFLFVYIQQSKSTAPIPEYRPMPAHTILITG
ncbi:MAG: hypothetical protein A2X81_08175 [Desulfobacterales bacterium GWB2_56_26]|nr:MAG: hypothetical protein A2X81_08175 [Desulfobacterales bacterium GWB2_56_26]